MALEIYDDPNILNSGEKIYNNDLQRDMDSQELSKIFYENKSAIDFTLALNSGIFSLSLQDYFNLPTKLINTIIFLKNEIVSKQNEKAKTINGN